MCVSPVGSSTFFIAKGNQVYDCGSNINGELGLEQGTVPENI